MKTKILFSFCALIVLILGVGVATGVLEITEFQKSEPEPESEDIFRVDLTDYLLIGYFYDSGGSVLVIGPIVGYQDESTGAEVIVTEKKTYCVKNWDYKILYSKPDLPRNKEPNKKF